MFDISWSELLLIAVAALIFIGPKELPRVLRTVGQMTGKIRRMAGEFQDQFREAMREAEMADLKKDIDEATSKVGESLDPLKDFKDATEWKPPEPATTSSTATTTTAATSGTETPGTETPSAAVGETSATTSVETGASQAGATETTTTATTTVPTEAAPAKLETVGTGGSAAASSSGTAPSAGGDRAA